MYVFDCLQWKTIASELKYREFFSSIAMDDGFVAQQKLIISGPTAAAEEINMHSCPWKRSFGEL